MRKILIIALIVLLLFLGGYLVLNKISLGSLEVLGVKEIKSESEILDNKIQQASRLTSTDYQSKLTEQSNSIKTLKKEKESYEELLAISNSDEVSQAVKFNNYEIEYIWAKTGDKATSEGIVLKLEVTRGSTNTQGLYDLIFTATGSYIGISDFIYDIENDDSLGFKIDEFKLEPGETTEELVGTFKCKDISMNLDQSKLVTPTMTNTTTNTANGEKSSTTNTTNKTNTTNTNATNSTTNTTNKTNTTNTTR